RRHLLGVGGPRVEPGPDRGLLLDLLRRRRGLVDQRLRLLLDRAGEACRLLAETVSTGRAALAREAVVLGPAGLAGDLVLGLGELLLGRLDRTRRDLLRVDLFLEGVDVLAELGPGRLDLAL